MEAWSRALLLLAAACGRVGFAPATTTDAPPRPDGGIITPAAACQAAAIPADAFVVDVASGDDANAGTSAAPWRTIANAYGAVPDGAVIVVRPGTYDESVMFTRQLALGVTLLAEPRYQARWISSDVAVQCDGCSGLAIVGFDITETSAGTDVPFVHVHASGSQVTLLDNIIHDRPEGPLVRINDGAHDVLVSHNAIYGPGTQAVHVSDAARVTVEDNVVFGQAISSSPLVWSEDQDGVFDPGNVFRRNVILHWNGMSDASPLELTGTLNALVENNLILGDNEPAVAGVMFINSTTNTTIRNNTVVGGFAGTPYAFRIEATDTALNTGLVIANNAWADPAGTMSRFATGGISASGPVRLSANAYWNAGAAIPSNAATDIVTPGADVQAVMTDPQLATLAYTVPLWNAATRTFNDGSTTPCAVLASLVVATAAIRATSPLAGAGDSTAGTTDDILGHPRPTTPSIGATEP